MTNVWKEKEGEPIQQQATGLGSKIINILVGVKKKYFGKSFLIFIFYSY